MSKNSSYSCRDDEKVGVALEGHVEKVLRGYVTDTVQGKVNEDLGLDPL